MRGGGGHLVAQAAFHVMDENIVAATVTEASSFGERVHNIFLMKVIAAIFDLYNGGRQGERIFLNGVCHDQREGEGRGWGNRNYFFLPFPTPFPHRPILL